MKWSEFYNLFDSVCDDVQEIIEGKDNLLPKEPDLEEVTRLIVEQGLLPDEHPQLNNLAVCVVAAALVTYPGTWHAILAAGYAMACDQPASETV